MTAALKGDKWSAARPGLTLPPEKTRYPFNRRLGGPQGRSGRAENLVPTGIWSWTFQPVVSRYTDWATGPTLLYVVFLNVTSCCYMGEAPWLLLILLSQGICEHGCLNMREAQNSRASCLKIRSWSQCNLLRGICPKRPVKVDSYRSTIKLDALHNLKLVCRYFLNKRGVFQIGASHRMHI